ncbi:MAG: protein kinase [bacterium]|nr:protein kinase [bacterium]
MSLSSDNLSMDIIEQIDRVADEFENAVRAGKPVRVEDVLEECNGLPRQVLLRELIPLEWELRRKRGERFDAEEYLARFPDDLSEVQCAVREALHLNDVTVPELGNLVPKRIGRFDVVRRLGSGGFGSVYLAVDPQLERQVAIKVPRAMLLAGSDHMDAFVREARAAAQLQHPSLVTVYDVQVENGRPYIVYQYVRGESLASWAKRLTLSPVQIVRIFIKIADALRYAHQHGVTHCDLKLGNILMDDNGDPHVTDFGLSRRDVPPERDEGQVSGTPNMMAPEQLLDGSVVDQRADIWSMGVMLYQLLCGKLPFRAKRRSELFQRICYAAAERLDVLDPSIPSGLADICERCLAKNPEERFADAGLLRLALEEWLRDAEVRVEKLAEEREPSQESCGQKRIVPRGLLEFTETDAESYLRLLPGPLAANGVPEAIQFWIRRLESRNGTDSFPVGLIYGSSGSGKSSLLRAGILPRLDNEKCRVIYLKASGSDLPRKLLSLMQVEASELKDVTSLSEACGRLAERSVAPKLVVVVDQFEQWLHIRHTLKQDPLVDALAHCDGDNLQCLLVVRDDFFASAHAFFQELGVLLREGTNYALVAPLSKDQARRVLQLLGQGYGSLDSSLSPENEKFLDAAVDLLAQDGYVNKLQLAWLAEMFKARRWTPDSLEQLGGIEGIGVAYLHEVINSDAAMPQCRVYSSEIRAALSVLVPPASCRIRGHAKSSDELYRATGLKNPQHWATVLRILVEELRLITPVDIPDAVDKLPGGAERSEAAERTVEKRKPEFYQLTHDYLVPSLRTLLLREKRETRRGRVQSKLEELAELWQVRSERRYLPNLGEWLEMVCLTSKASWNQSQQNFMRSARNYHLSCLTLIALLLTSTIWIIREYRERQFAATLVERVGPSGFAGLPELSNQIHEKQRWALPALVESLERGDADSLIKLKAKLVTLWNREVSADLAIQCIPLVKPQELTSLQALFEPYAPEICGELWSEAESQLAQGNADGLKITSLLASFDTDHGSHWNAMAPDIVDMMLDNFELDARFWIEYHLPVKELLLEPLKEAFVEDAGDSSQSRGTRAAEVLAAYCSEEPQLLCELMLDASPEQFQILLPVVRSTPNFPMQRLVAVVEREESTAAHIALPPDPLTLSPDIELRLVAAQGRINPQMAFCQALPMEELPEIAEQLKSSGYRPLRVRPFSAQDQLYCSAIWRRDGRDSHLDIGLSKSGVEAKTADLQDTGLVPIDVAGYVGAKSPNLSQEDDELGPLQERFVLVWGENESDWKDIGIYVGVSQAEQWAKESKLAGRGRRELPALQSYLSLDGSIKYCGIVAKSKGSSISVRDLSLTEYQQIADLDRIPIDISLMPYARDGSGTALERNRKVVDDLTKDWNLSDWSNVALSVPLVAEAQFHLGELDEALRHCNGLVIQKPQLDDAYRLRSLIRAASGRRDAALADLATFERLNLFPEQRLVTRAMVLAYFGEEEASLNALSSLQAQQPERMEFAWYASKGYAACCQIAESKGNISKAASYRERAMEMLGECVTLGMTDWLYVERCIYFDGLRELEDYQRLAGAAPKQFVWSAVRSVDHKFESRELSNLTAAEHLSQSQSLIEQGFQPVALCYAVHPGHELESGRMASVWHRPRPMAELAVLDARRRSNAAALLFQLGAVDYVWQLVGGTVDASLRTRMLHLLNATACQPEPLIERLGSELDVFKRRSLILALGEYDAVQVNGLIQDRLLRWYEFDPDPGIHAACEWTLKRWGREQGLRKINQRLATGKVEDGRRWYRSRSNEHTFVVFDGPVEYFSGGLTPGRQVTNLMFQSRVRRRIRRSFAISMHEVTADQLDRCRNHYRISLENPWEADWDRNCAAGAVAWRMAMLYCEWLNEVEGIPESEWLTRIPTLDANAVKLCDDFLSQQAYRLPTSVEWEYAARGGVDASRYFGESPEFLQKYIWYSENSQGVSQPIGSLKPNDFGLFDMLGNVEEWALQPRCFTYGVTAAGDDIEYAHQVSSSTKMAVRGGSAWNTQPHVRVAIDRGEFNHSPDPMTGFRIARTWTP